MDKNLHEQFMHRAIELSERASLIEKTGGVYLVAVIVKEGKIIGEGYNQVIKNNDPTWHAEMHAIREACKTIGSPHLDGCIIYIVLNHVHVFSCGLLAHIDQIFLCFHCEDAKAIWKFSGCGYF